MPWTDKYTLVADPETGALFVCETTRDFSRPVQYEHDWPLGLTLLELALSIGSQKANARLGQPMTPRGDGYYDDCAGWHHRLKDYPRTRAAKTVCTPLPEPVARPEWRTEEVRYGEGVWQFYSPLARAWVEVDERCPPAHRTRQDPYQGHGRGCPFLLAVKAFDPAVDGCSGYGVARVHCRRGKQITAWTWVRDRETDTPLCYTNVVEAARKRDRFASEPLEEWARIGIY